MQIVVKILRIGKEIKKKQNLFFCLFSQFILILFENQASIWLIWGLCSIRDLQA